MDIISWPFVSGSLLFEVVRLEYWYAFYLGDDFWIYLRVQLRLVRQCLHVHEGEFGSGARAVPGQGYARAVGVQLLVWS